jgi:hypothetical protein
MLYRLILPRFWPLWWLKVFFYQKTFFSTYFDLKHLNNHVKFIHGLKKTKLPSQKPKSTRTENQPELRYIFSRILKVKKAPNMNSSHQKKLFNINIVCFGSLNLYQQHVFLSTAEIRRPLSLFSQPGIKNNKNKLLYQK